MGRAYDVRVSHPVKARLAVHLWVATSRITAQLLGPLTKQFDVELEGQARLQDLDLVQGPGRSQYASLTWADLTAIAPWLELTNRINGPGLGH